MKQYILRRVGYSLLSLFLLSLTIFLFVRVTGDPVSLLVEPGASPEDIENMRRQLGLDQPIWVQYWHFVASFLTGDLGLSFYYRTPVIELYFQRLPNSLLLAAVAMTLSLLIGIPSGILAAVRVDGFWDSAGKIFALLGLSLPQFWVGLVLILFFSVYLGWLPSSGSGSVLHLLMPAFTLGWYFAAAHMRLTRSSMLEVLGQDYVRTARAKGLRERVVVLKHAMRNALIPLITIFVFTIPNVFSGALITETIFNYKGLGFLYIQALGQKDWPIVSAFLLINAILIVIANLLADILYTVADPRIRLD